MEDQFELYKNAILEKYEIAKKGKNSNYLLNPTPGNLKRLASEIAMQKMTARDEIVFNNFFLLNPNTNSYTQIKRFDTERFRPFSNFLKSKSNLKDIASADLLAVLVDLQNRPYLKFKESEYRSEEIVGVDSQDEEIVEKKDFVGVTLNDKEIVITKNRKRNFLKIGVFLVFIAVSSFVIHKATEEKCMIWIDDHYEKIDCDNAEDPRGSAEIVPLDNLVLSNFKKLKVTDTTRFFKNGLPLVWYLKQNNECEYFSAPGFHPISKKTLKQISTYIVDKHVLKTE